MLLNRWENVNTRRGGEVAFRHSERPAGVSFREIDQMAGEVDGLAALEVARVMDRGSKRIKRRVGVL